jgi:hypothetical protein
VAAWDPDAFGNFFGRPRQHDDTRTRTVYRAVVLVEQQVLRFPDDLSFAHDGL